MFDQTLIYQKSGKGAEAMAARSAQLTPKLRSMLILIDPEIQWLAEPAGKMGRPAVFSDVAIQLCLSVKVLFKLPLRQAVGMVRARPHPARPDFRVLANPIQLAGERLAEQRVVGGRVAQLLEGRGEHQRPRVEQGELLLDPDAQVGGGVEQLAGCVDVDHVR